MDTWDNRFLNLAKTISDWSKDPSTKVGCVIVDTKRQVVGLGYNGFPRGVKDHQHRLDDRPTKYLMVQHAEANAVLNATASVDGCTAYVTHMPCASCAGILIQSGVKRICTTRPTDGIAERFAESFAITEIMLGETGIDLVFL